MSNSTENQCELITAQWFNWYAGVLACAAFLLNFFVFLTVLRYKALRSQKEYCIIAALAFADVQEAGGSFLACLYRFPIFYFAKTCFQVSPLYCMALPYSIMWRWSDSAKTLMYCAVSIDRIHAVAFPVSYFKADRRYAMKIIGVVWGISLINLLVACINPVSMAVEEKTVSIVCYHNSFIAPNFYLYAKYSSAIYSACSVLLYIIVFISYSRNKKKIHPEQSQQLIKHNKNQLRLAKTIAISTTCTFLFDTIPRYVGQYLEHDPNLYLWGVSYTQMIWQITAINGMCNFFIYPMHHKEMRYALKCLFKCKTLPNNLSSWNLDPIISVAPQQQQEARV